MPVDSGVLMAPIGRGLAPVTTSFRASLRAWLPASLRASTRDALNVSTISWVVRSSFAEYMRGEAPVVCALRREGDAL